MQQVLALIRKDVAEDKVRIDTPTQNLESYFLDVVQKARQAAAETSGATSGARVAAYLRGDGTPAGQPAADKLLERLALPTAPNPLPESKPAAPATVDESRLSALAQAAPAALSTPAPAHEPAPAPADLQAANDKLAGLVNKPKN